MRAARIVRTMSHVFNRRVFLSTTTMLTLGCASSPADRASHTWEREMTDSIDVAIVGGGPAGLAAALTLGRARKRAVLFDAGPRRNARAHAIHNFVTRDGTPPDVFRSEARAQLAQYPTIRCENERVASIAGTENAFVVESDSGKVRARRVLLATGMRDAPLALDGADALWGHAIFQCPFCHGFEHVGVPWGLLAREKRSVDFALMLTGWTRDITFFTNGSPLDDDGRARLAKAQIVVEERAMARLIGDGEKLRAIRFVDGSERACGALFAHPQQSQVPLVDALGLEIDANGFVETDPMRKETSVKGIFAAGDLASGMHSAIAGAAAGTHAAAMIVHDLNTHDALAG